MAATVQSYANIPFWNSLPMMYTNYAGDTQISTIEPYDGYNIQYGLNPVAMSSIGNCLAAPAYYGGGSVEIPPAAMAAGRAMADYCLDNMTKQNFNTHLNSISQMKMRLNSEFQDPNKTEEQRNKIEEMIKKLDQQAEKLKEIMESTELDSTGKYQQEEQLRMGTNVLIRELLKELQDMKANSNADSVDDANNDGSDNVGNDGNANSADDVDGSNDADNANGADDDADVDSTQNNSTVDNFDVSTKAAVDQLYDAMYCWGTDDQKMEEVLNLVNKDNVMDLMLAWNKFHSAEKGESFMEAFMWDADSGFLCAGGQKVKYGKLIARALRDKAEELGVYDELRSDFAAIDKEMGSIFYVSNDVYKNYDNIIKVIAEKMGSKYGSPTSTKAPESEENK